jgi:hypothetical protein
MTMMFAGRSIMVFLFFARGFAMNNSTYFLDRFNYHETSVRGDGFIDYAPNEWGKIECDEQTAESLDKCEGYNRKWHEGINWTIQDNFCRWCPVGSDLCGRHHQSPINLLREVGLDPNISFVANECIVSQMIILYSRSCLCSCSCCCYWMHAWIQCIPFIFLP